MKFSLNTSTITDACSKLEAAKIFLLTNSDIVTSNQQKSLLHFINNFHTNDDIVFGSMYYDQDSGYFDTVYLVVESSDNGLLFKVTVLEE